jgi:hypothetical protein
MKRRRMLIEADPKRQEAKTKKKLAKLKKKMEAMQQKKASKKEETSEVKDETDEALLESRKRKRDEDDESEGDAVAKEEEEEAAQLESALDMLQDDAGLAHKTREEAEIDRQKLLAGAGLQWDEEEEAADVKRDEVDGKLSQEEINAEILRRSGVVIVSDDDEATVVGGNRILPWRQGYKSIVVKKEENGSEESDRRPVKARAAIKFKSEFPGLIELDANGRVIDKGDDDYMPSSKWIGRKGGFEYKLGERGLGYYRTGKKVVVPSNVAYAL